MSENEQSKRMLRTGYFFHPNVKSMEESQILIQISG